MVALARRAWKLGAADWALLAESMTLAMGIEIALRLMPFSRVLQWSGRLRRAGPSGPAGSDVYRQLARFTAAAYRLLPVRSTCLRESLVLCALLNRRGARARLYLGVDKNGAALAAHAWVECDGVASEGARSSFRELRTSPH
jgi:hypothetical protein